MPTSRKTTRAARHAKSPKPAAAAGAPAVRGELDHAGPGTWLRSAWASAPLALIAAAFVAYHNSLAGPFVFDDVPNVRENLKLRRMWPIWESMWGPLKTGVSGRPLVQLSFALNYALHGL